MTQLMLMTLSTGSMPLNILLLVGGIVLVLKSADWLTDGAVAMASRFGVSQIVIGLTIVAMGTSMPELCVSLVSALKGTPDLAVGNVVGSNIFNTLLIVGCSALVAPLVVKPSTVRRDMLFALLASAMLLVMCADGTVSRSDAALLLVAFAVFMTVTLRGSKDAGDDCGQAAAPTGMARAALLIVCGLAGLVGGSNVFVDNASYVAAQFGVSDAVIGLTIVAGGTSLPELATSMVAARKGNSDIAIGNVIGSNVFNILMILGVTGAVAPLHIQGITTVDLSTMGVSTVVLWLFARTKYTVARWEGGVLVALFAAYMWWLIATV